MADIAEVIHFSSQEILDFCKRNIFLITSLAVTGVGVLALRKYFAGGVCHSNARLDGKTVVITGANTGIGKQTAKDLALRGARVIFACRGITKAERAAADVRNSTGNSSIDVKLIDLSSLQSIRNFCKNINVKKIDILINNAGVMACPNWKSADGYQMQFAVNHLGHFLLTNLLIGELKAAGSSRIINVSSLAHERGNIAFDNINAEKNYNPWAAYSQSKLANILFTRTLHKKYSDSGVTAYAIHPGVVKTELGRYLPLLGTPKWKTWLWKIFGFFVLKNSVQGAQTSIYCAVQPGLEENSGKYFSDCNVKKPAPQAENDDTAERLWKLSCEMTGFKDET